MRALKCSVFLSCNLHSVLPKDRYAILPLAQSQEVISREWTKVKELTAEFVGKRVLYPIHTNKTCLIKPGLEKMKTVKEKLQLRLLCRI